MKNYHFYKSLHARGVTLESLAAELGTKPGHLSMVFNNQRGANTRKHIVKHLTPAELSLLGWNERGALVEKGGAAAPPKEISSQV